MGPMNKSVQQDTRQPMNSSAPQKQPIMSSVRVGLVLLMEATVLQSVSKCQVYKRVVTRCPYRSHLKTVNKCQRSHVSRLPSKYQNSNALKYLNKIAHKCLSRKQSKCPNKSVTRYPRNIVGVSLLNKQSCSPEEFQRKFVGMVGQVDEEVEVVDIMVGQEEVVDTMVGPLVEVDIMENRSHTKNSLRKTLC